MQFKHLYRFLSVNFLARGLKKSLRLFAFLFFMGQVAIANGLVLSTEKGILSQIPENSVVQGSSDFGGTQPPFLVNFNDSAFEPLKNEIQKINSNPNFSFEEKLYRLTLAVHQSIPNGDYSNSKRIQLNKKYLSEKILKKTISIICVFFLIIKFNNFYFIFNRFMIKGFFRKFFTF